MRNLQDIKHYTQKIRNENNVPKHTVFNEASTGRCHAASQLM